MTSQELKRFLQKKGAIFTRQAGSHLHVVLNGNEAIIPMHGKNKELKIGTVQSILKRLGLKE